MENIKYSCDEKIAIITIDRPDKLNALNRKSMIELSECWEIFKEDNSTRVAVLTGEGERAFCVGMDLKEGIGEEDVEKGMDLILRISPKYHGIYKPIICAIKGYCLGFGWWLAMECDLRIASTDAKLGIPENKFNISPVFGGLLAEYLPPAIALEVLLTGEPLDSTRAYEIGFLNRIVEKDKVEEEALKLARQICKNAPVSVRRTKELYYESLRMMSRHGSISLAKYIHKELKGMSDT